MRLKHLQFPFEIKALEKDKKLRQTLRLLFNNADSYRDVLGALARLQKTLASCYKPSSTLPPMLSSMTAAARRSVPAYTKMP